MRKRKKTYQSIKASFLIYVINLFQQRKNMTYLMINLHINFFSSSLNQTKNEEEKPLLIKNSLSFKLEEKFRSNIKIIISRKRKK